MERIHTFGFCLASKLVPEEERHMGGGRLVLTAAVLDPCTLSQISSA